MKSKVLFIMHTPPPVHGAAMMGKYIKDSRKVNETFDCKFINLSMAQSINDIGKAGFKKLIKFIKLLNNIRKGITGFKPDLVYITPNTKGGAFIKDFIIVSLAKILHKNIIIHFHNKGVSKYQDKPLYNFLYKRFFKNVKVILLAEPLYDDIRKYVDIENVFFCANGIPQTTIKDKETNNKRFNILFLSNMMKEKGVWTLLEACDSLKKRGYDFECNFVGKWSDITEEEFYKRVNNSNLDEYVFAHGAKYGEEKTEYFANADIFILPTYDDCFPLTLLEAFEYGLPCIASDEGGISGIIDNGKNGFVIEKKNPNILAEKMSYFIDNKSVMMFFGINARNKFLKKYTLQIFEKNIISILSKNI